MDQQPQTTNSQPTETPSSNSSQFTPSEPPKGKKTGLLIAIAAGVVVLGIIAFMVLGSDKKDGTNTNSNSSSSSNSSDENAASNKLQKYDVSDSTTGLKYSVLFYKDATVSEKSGRTFLTSGETGSQYSVFLSAAKEGKLDCKGTPSTTMKLNGESTTVCYESKNTQYAGYVTAKNVTAQLNVAGQKAISMEDAKAILESVTFN